MNDTHEITRSSDIGTPELHRQFEGGIENKVTHEGQRRAYNTTQTAMDFYRNQGAVNERQWQASEEYYRLWYYGAEKSRFITIELSREPRGLPNYESAIIMEEKYNNASRAIQSTAAAIVVYNVVCIGEWARAVKVAFGINKRIILLRDGLDDLVRHFGI